MANIIWYCGDSTIWGSETNNYEVQVSPTPVVTFASNLPSTLNATVLNKGIIGETAALLLAGHEGFAPWVSRMNAEVDLDWVILNHGINDAKTLTPAEFKSNMRQLVEIARQYGKFPILETPNPAPGMLDGYGKDMTLYANATIALGQEMAVPVIDQYNYLRNHYGTGTSEWDYIPDGLHPDLTTYTLKGEYAAQRFTEIAGESIMALVIEDRVMELSTSGGTGDITVSGALTAMRAFADVCLVGDAFYGFIEEVDAEGNPTGPWEGGYYTYSAANTISRTSVIRSSNSNAAVDFAIGTNKFVYIDLMAYQIKQMASGGTVTPSPGPGPTPAPDTSVKPYNRNPALYGNMSFQDEFNGTSLNRNLWNDAIWYSSSDATINYDVSGGCLNIWPQPNASGQYVNRTIDTDGKWEQAFGYYEARIKWSKGYGCFGAFWLLAHPGVRRPELDIMETYNGAPTDSNPDYQDGSYNPIDVVATAWRPIDVSPGFAPLGDRRLSVYPSGIPASEQHPQDLSDNFHIYGVEWTSTYAQFTFQGYNLGPPIMTNELTHPMYILCDLWWTSELAGDPNVASNPKPPNGKSNSSSFDYVRAWPMA